MRQPYGRLTKLLVAWYGLFQAGHLVFNGRYLLNPGVPPFPPPPAGWAPSTVQLLNGIALMDLVNAVLALGFVYGYFTRARWALWLGTVTLTISLYAAAVFTYGTVAMGAWEGYVRGYLWTYIPFLPVIILAVVISRQAIARSMRLHEHEP